MPDRWGEGEGEDGGGSEGAELQRPNLQFCDDVTEAMDRLQLMRRHGNIFS